MLQNMQSLFCEFKDFTFVSDIINQDLLRYLAIIQTILILTFKMRLALIFNSCPVHFMVNQRSDDS